MSERIVEFHGHDFDWATHAQRCKEILANQVRDNDDEGQSASQSSVTTELALVAKKNWEVFHKNNQGKVYKPRNYLTQEFSCVRLLCSEQKHVDILEIGCGYGSAIFPILHQCPQVQAQVCDLSPTAIEILQQSPDYDTSRCRAFVCDIVNEELNDVEDGSIDVALMIFFLSALQPESFASAIRKVYTALRPGGLICFRDYGLYDLAMMRSEKCLGPSLYYRSDGTLAYFFSKEDVEQYFHRECGFDVIENEYCTVRLRNRKKAVIMDRVWVHAVLQKPHKDKDHVVQTSENASSKQ